MAKGLGTLTVWLTADSSKFNRGVLNAKKAMAQFNTIAYAGAAASAAAIVTLGIKSVKSFMVQEDAVNRLRAALIASGDATAYTLPIMQKYASEIQRTTKYGDEQVLAALAYGKNLGIQTDQLQEAGKAAAGLAAKYSIDLNTAMMLVGRASQGQTQMLARYGIVLDKTGTKEQQFAQLLKIGASSFGLAEAEAKTLSGSITQMGNAWGDVQEGIGAVISEVLRLPELFQWLGKEFGGLAEYLQNNIHSISYMIEFVFIEIQYSFKQIIALAENVGTGISTVFTAAGNNLLSVGQWVYDNFVTLVENFWNFFLATMKDMAKIQAEVASNILKTIMGKEVDWTSLFSNMKTEMLKAASGKIGLGELVLDNSALNFSGAYNKVLDDIDRINKEKLEKQAGAFESRMAKAGAIGEMPGGGKKPETPEAAKAKVKIESPIVGAIHRGTIEALKAETTRRTKEDKIEQNTRKTAGGIERIAKGIDKLVGKFPMGGMDLEEAI